MSQYNHSERELIMSYNVHCATLDTNRVVLSLCVGVVW